MKLHEIYPHNKFLFYTGAILTFTGGYLDDTNKAGFAVTISLLFVGLLLMLLSFKKPKLSKGDEL
jgi:hypothetical protein